MYTARQKLRELVAASAAFQTKVGAADETAALARVYSPTAPADYSAPCCLVSVPAAMQAGQSGHANHDFDLLFEIPVAAATEDAAAFGEIEQWVDDVRREIMAEQWNGGRLVVRALTIIFQAGRGRRRGGATPGETSQPDEAVRQDFVTLTLGAQTGLVNPP